MFDDSGARRVGAVRQYARAFHPGRLRFRRLLRTLTLDLDDLPAQIPDLEEQDFVITGCPRTGTSLLSGLLFQPPHVVTVTEPWDAMRLPPAQLFADLRAQVERTGWLRAGTLDLSALEEGRIQRIPEVKAAARVEVERPWMLGVKWPSYVQLMDRMPGTKFIVCLRHPLDTIASFKLIGGSVSKGLDYEIPFNRALNTRLRRAAASDAERRVALYEEVHQTLRPHLGASNVVAVRYEDWFRDPEAQWSRLTAFLALDLPFPELTIRKADRRSVLTYEDRSLISERCNSAEWLGYDTEGLT